MNQSFYTIRNYQPDDFNNFFQLQVETDQFDQSGRYLTPRILTESLGRPHFAPEKDLFLAEVEGKIVGFCNITSELRIGRVLFDFLVHPKYRRKGIATKLIEKAFRRAKECRAQVVQAEVQEAFLSAKDLLSGLGFRPVRSFLELSLVLHDGSRTDVAHSLINHALKRGEEDRLTQLQNRLFAGTWGFNPNTTEEIAYRLNLSCCSPDDVIMLYNGNEPIGYCWTTINSEENLALNIKRGRIHMMGVDPDYRGKGLGKAVLSTGLTHLMERGIELAELTVDSSNTVACSLYKSAGFEIRATTLWYEKELT